MTMGASASGQRRRVGTVAVFLALVMLPSCVGPSRTHEDYERKAAHTAEAMISTGEAALLTAELATDGRAPAPFVSLRFSEAEEAASAVESAFGAVQPPHPGLDELRTEVLTAVGDAGDLIEELRIRAFRGHLDRLGPVARDLDRAVDELRRFTELAPT